KQFNGGVRLMDGPSILPGGERSTIVHLFAEFTPRNILGMAAIPVVGQGSMKNTMAYLTDFLKINPPDEVERLPAPRNHYSFELPVLLHAYEGMSEMRVDRQISDLFRRHLHFANDDEVVDMNPYHLADRWGKPRVEVLRWFLHATKAGITNLSWHLICPNCRVAKTDLSSLSGVTEQFHCDFCGIAYSPSFDKYVELTFSIHPSIRKAQKYTYCVGGPTITPHIFVQSIVEKGTAAEVDVPDETIEYRIRVLQHNHSVNIHRLGFDSALEPGDFSNALQPETQSGKGSPQDEQAQAERPRVTYRDAGWDCVELKIPQVMRTILVRNDSDRDIVLASEKTDWSQDAVTAAEVTAMGEFRRMFSSEVLAPGRQISVGNVTLMFTDLLGSTVFYEEVGDAPAYGQVQRHFAYLQRWIEANHGSMVKTIGDAVMAVFTSPEHGLAAALEAQLNIEGFNEGRTGTDRIVIKIGLHTGPAIVVNLNDRLDYFGRTANLAARIQGTSRGGDVVVSGSVMEHAPVSNYLKTQAVRVTPFETELKGIDGAERLYRITVS
ncbi:MAG TPA: adenylate/guanylate cyclase domain-containing protein, partial [Spirochaetia bacterium]|nr:adenylate/guanylate cyclase domain-containing protein [Spirochaetia bacterium]